MLSPVVLVCGAGTGLGLILAIRELFPARPDLVDALRRLDPDAARPPEQTARPAGLQGWPDVLGGRLISTLGDAVRVPRKDLELLRRTPARYLGVKALWALFGLIVPQVLFTMLAWLGVSFPLLLTGGLSVALAVFFWMKETKEVHQQAQRLRLEYRWAIASYLERVELARGAGIGAAKALLDASEVGDMWCYVRLRAALEQAQLSGATYWDALKQLADELDVPELARPAETLALAGEESASVRESLSAQAKQLRGALLADAKAEANVDSQRMIVPVVGLVFLMVTFVLYAAVVQIFSS